MKRLTLSVVLAALVLPANALGAPCNGVVLSIDSARHLVEVVDPGHLVHAYRYQGPVANLHLGRVISYHRSRASISHIRAAAGGSHSVSFYARVVRSSPHRLAVRMSDGRTAVFGPRQLMRPLRRRAEHPVVRARVAIGMRPAIAGVRISVDKLSPGMTVLVTEFVHLRGGVTVAVSYPRSAG